jgi:hypothetical protein
VIELEGGILATAMSRVSAKNIFYDKLKELNDPMCNRSVFLDNERYDNIKREVEEAKMLRQNNQPLNSKQYRRLKRYEVIKIGDTKKLIESGPGQNDDSNIRYYCKMEELFDVLLVLVRWAPKMGKSPGEKFEFGAPKMGKSPQVKFEFGTLTMGKSPRNQV